MGRHLVPRYNRRRLVIAGAAAVTMIGVTVGIGIYGSAFAEDEPVAAASGPCLPDVADPAANPAETEPPAETEADPTAPPAETETGTEAAEEPTDPAEEPTDPAEEPTDPAEEPTDPAEEPAEPAEEPTEPAEEPEVPDDTAKPEVPDHGSHEMPDEQGPEPATQAPEPPADAAMQTFGAPNCTARLGPFPEDFVKIWRVRPSRGEPRPGRGGSTGTFVSNCGTNENGHNNPDNFITSPGVANAAQHVHDYVGNLSTDGFSTDESLQAAGTTCRNGDKSTYFWPVLRVRERNSAPDETNPHNVGTILRPTAVSLQFRGNPRSKVVAMPQVLRVITGDAKAATNGPASANAKWTCTGFGNRFTTKYPICPRGSQVQRVLDFPSCWDGANTDSENHRTHIVFPGRNGACPEGTKAVPQLRMTLNYSVPRGRVFAVDAFPEQQHDPITDHGDFANVMPDRLMNRAVFCINSGRNC